MNKDDAKKLIDAMETQRLARSNFKCSECGAPIQVREPERTKAAFCMGCTMKALDG